MVLERAAKCVTGRLSTLNGIEDIRCSMAVVGFLKRLRTEVRIHGVGYPLDQALVAVPVQNRHNIHKYTCYGSVGQIRSPDLVGSFNIQID